jgi:MOSC domain-containing protein YiiM
MQTAPRHVTATELEANLATVIASPADVGRLEVIVIRPAENERRVLTSATLSPERGVEGDRWRVPNRDGAQPDPSCQVSIMNARILRQIAAEEDAVCLAGDNLIVDFDLSEANAPAGTRLAIGDSVVIEISDTPHTGCAKFAGRYGNEARSFINNPLGSALHLRGRYARIITPGIINVGDNLRKQ